ncbi:hypothetical protein HET73_05490 [Wolbachia endosymbiont of Atemnus politus]|uniref:hypothetical protein n=1 Tax=Wolbachia endosymbiont of Atemnus politus TaxID=2682840 RepID=UPI001573C9B1|nr:hypothetical protein [Wolbachia endosymbiont of Atemnus politus]NSM56819.1 hypothetical protein [Wolbachia endosymbiont of Atemnus politus]
MLIIQEFHGLQEKFLQGGSGCLMVKKSEARVNNQNTPQQGESPDGKRQTVEPSKN